MCLAVLALHVHPDYPFICIGNRDEFHNRPTAPLHFWDIEPTGLWAGKDLQQGGTWLALGQNGQFALLTNVRNSLLNMPATAPSRGTLVLQTIFSSQGPEPEEAARYAGFNLVHGDLSTVELNCTSNQALRLANGVPYSTRLSAGVYGLSNGYLDASWPKSNLLKERLLEEIQMDKRTIERGAPANTLALEEKLLWLLDHTEQADDASLPSTGVPFEWEKMLSAIKIVSPHYGTRSSAVVLLDKNRCVHFTEVSFDASGNEIGRQRIEISLAPG